MTIQIWDRWKLHIIIIVFTIITADCNYFPFDLCSNVLCVLCSVPQACGKYMPAASNAQNSQNNQPMEGTYLVEASFWAASCEPQDGTGKANADADEDDADEDDADDDDADLRLHLVELEKFLN